MAKFVALTVEGQIGAISELESSLGWEVIKQHLQKNIQNLATEILDDIDDTIPADQKRILNLKRHFQEKLLKLPKSLKEALEEAPDLEAVEYDPFE